MLIYAGFGEQLACELLKLTKRQYRARVEGEQIELIDGDAK